MPRSKNNSGQVEDTNTVEDANREAEGERDPDTLPSPVVHELGNDTVAQGQMNQGQFIQANQSRPDQGTPHPDLLGDQVHPAYTPSSSDPAGEITADKMHTDEAKQLQQDAVAKGAMQMEGNPQGAGDADLGETFQTDGDVVGQVGKQADPQVPVQAGTALDPSLPVARPFPTNLGVDEDGNPVEL